MDSLAGMDYVRLGSSGLEISRIIVGAMSFGDSGTGSHAWTLSIDDSRPIVRDALDRGITTFDTANVYSLGTGEEFLGEMLRDYASREDIQILTKVHARMRPGPNGGGLSRAAILHEIDASLRRLGTDYVDLYQIHRWDPEVPVEETMEALHDVVKAGKARYIGASSMFAWQFGKLQHAADLGGWTRFVSMQDHYNLLSREEEREMHPFCVDQGVGVIPWSPLARGRLTRPVDVPSARSETDQVSAKLYKQSEDSDRLIIDAVASLAENRGVPRAQIALAWVLSQPAVSAPIVGATKLGHIADAVDALEIQLDPDEIAALEEHYLPRAPEGF